MAQSEHLPIYKRSYELCLYLEQVVRGFSRYEKYALGSELRELSRRALRLVVRANSRRDKAPVLLELRETIEELKVLLRLAQDAKAFQKFSSFEHAISLAVDVARQTEGWLKSQRGGPGPSGPRSHSRGAATGPLPRPDGQNPRATPSGIGTPSAP